MAEAVAALSVAANVIQFVDFGGRVISTAWAVHQRGSDGFGEAMDLERTAKDLTLVLAGLRVPLEVQEDGSKTESQQSVEELVDQCSKLAGDMLASLSKIGLSDKLRKRDALRAAFRMAWKEDEIKHQQTRLDGIRHQLNLHILMSLRCVDPT
jgi:hypothetical protein